MLNQIYLFSYIYSSNISKIFIFAKTDGSNVVDNFNHLIEMILNDMANFLEHICEGVSLFIIGVAMLSTLKRVLNSIGRLRNHDVQASIRLEFGEALAMSLTFLLAADIVATAIAPSWDSLGKLAVIAIIRTALNYFLALEVKELEEKKHHKQTAIIEDI